MKKLFFFLLISIFFVSCHSGYNRDVSCDLDKLNLKGNIVKMELITQTTIPISEWLYTTYDKVDLSRSYKHDAVYSFMGNSVLEFNNKGNICSQRIYNNQGKLLYNNKFLTSQTVTLYNPINPNINELVDELEFSYDETGRIVSQKTFHKGKLFLTRKVLYNSQGDIDKVICDFDGLAFHYGEDLIVSSDTTFFIYLEYDSFKNWTLAEIYHKGRLSTDKYKFKVRRKITYYNEDTNDSQSLISQLPKWIEETKLSNDSLSFALVKKECFEKVLSLNIPSNAPLDIRNPMPNSLLYRMETKNGFFCVFLNYEQPLGNIFKDMTIEEADKGYSIALAQSGDLVLGFLDYSSKELINNQQCSYLKYYSYASAGYLSTGDPVITEMYKFQPVYGGMVYSVNIGYDSYHKYLYEELANKIKNSITINLNN